MSAMHVIACIIVCIGVVCGTHVFVNLKFANNNFKVKILQYGFTCVNVNHSNNLYLSVIVASNWHILISKSARGKTEVKV